MIDFATTDRATLAHPVPDTGLRRRALRAGAWARDRVGWPAPAPGGGARTAPPAQLAFIVRVVFAAMAIVMTAALVAAAPRTVTVPIAVAFVGGLAAGGLVAAGDRWLTRRGRGERLGEAGWGALGAGSLALLAIALAATERLRVVLAAVAIAGLVAVRLAALRAGWAPRGIIASGRLPRPAASLMDGMTATRAARAATIDAGAPHD